MMNKKLGLLLLPLVPLSAIGIVEVANAIVAPEPVVVIEEPCSIPDVHPVVTSQPAPPPVVAAPARPQPAAPK